MPKGNFLYRSKGQPACVCEQSWMVPVRLGMLVWECSFVLGSGGSRGGWREIKHLRKHFGVETSCPIAQDNIFFKATNQNQTEDTCICVTWVSLVQYCVLLGVYHCYPEKTKLFCVWAFCCVPSFLTCLLRVILLNLLKCDECTSALHSRLKEIYW